ncbi:MAG: YdcF family protein, partial [Propionibacterium sp.]|nr:YdcF family protein [Propionibacterium sp.]
MEPIILLLLSLGLFLLGAVLAAVEPRRLLPGLVLTTSLIWMALLATQALFSGIIDRLGLERGAWIILGSLAALVALVALLGVFLLLNAWTMARRERLSPAAMASGGIGALLLGYIGLSVFAIVADSFQLVVWLMLIGLPVGYLAWVFASFLLYTGLYGGVMRLFVRPVEAVVVLGAGLGGGERVTPLLAARLDLGRRVYERSRLAAHDTILVPSGGQGDDEIISEAEAMGRYLEDAGVPKAHIALEDRSTNTEENLEFSRELLRARDVDGRVAVTTNNFHAFRAALLMRRAGMPGYSLGGPTARYYWPSATVREYMAILRDHL